MSLSLANTLGKTLFIQLDNVYRENKNVHLYRFLSYLVEMKIFERIEVSYLPVGHTHNDVDQIFSTISKRLFKSKALTLNDLFKKILESNKEVRSQKTKKNKKIKNKKLK